MNWATRFVHLFQSIYDRLCGRPPNVRFWHFQWSALKDLYADLREVLPLCEGTLLDVGCGSRPYMTWCTNVTHYVGADVSDDLAVDILIHPNSPWPVASHSFDSVLCTQVLEHASDFEHVIEEIERVLKVGGRLVVTVPFLYQTHGLPHDYRRLSAEGVKLALRERFEVCDIRRQGAIGSTLAYLSLGWIEASSHRSGITRLLLILATPLWLPLCAAVNLFGVALDSLDVTGAFYGNVMILARKR